MARRTPERITPPSDGFEFISPWMPAKQAEGFYIVALSPKHGAMWRWRFHRVHGKEGGTGRPFVHWVLDESSARVDTPAEGSLLSTATLFDEPKLLTHPRDKHEATTVVLARWSKVQATPLGGKVPDGVG